MFNDFWKKKPSKNVASKNTRQKKGHFKSSPSPTNVDFPTIQGPTSCRTQMEQTFQTSEFEFELPPIQNPFFLVIISKPKNLWSLTPICALKAGQKPLHEKWPQAPNEIQAVVLRVGGAFPQLYLNGQPEEVEDSAAMVMSGSRPHYPPRDPKKKVCVESKICPNLPDLVEDMFPFFLEIIYIYIYKCK